jgi:3-deoxy-D-manno-octulosonate 8-phosphate phosphatase (KDO 8-P phosphatase)
MMALPQQVAGSVQKIKFVLVDVDGVLTDGRVGLLPDGGEIKYFSIYDGLAIRIAQQAGIEVGFISGRRSKAVVDRGKELGVEVIIQGSNDKVKDVTELLRTKDLKQEEIAYVGDDLPDIPLLRQVGFSAAPRNAAELVKYHVHYVTRTKGGDGAVREVIDLLLRTTGKWDEVMERLDAPTKPMVG